MRALPNVPALCAFLRLSALALSLPLSQAMPEGVGRAGAMEEFVRGYWLWIFLAAVFIALHWVGHGHGEGRRHDAERRKEGAGEPERDEREATPSGRRGGCH